MIHIVLWKWQQRHLSTDPRVADYRGEHVEIMAAMLRRNITLPHRVICITDDPSAIVGVKTYPLWSDFASLPNATKGYLPSCYRRLKLYDRKTQAKLGIKEGDRIVSLDLDTVIVGSLDKLLQTEGRYVGWAMRGSRHPIVFNGSLQMFTAGDLQGIWDQFDPDFSPGFAFERGWLGSDQSWLSMNLVGKPGSVGLTHPAIVSYPLQARLQGISSDNALVFFHGLVKPWDTQTRSTEWVGHFWRM